MSFYEKAKELARQGFHVFPLVENKKIPYIETFTPISTCDPESDTLKTFWTDPVLGFEHRYNIGIATSKFKKSMALLVIDIDNKKGKNGDKTLLELELEGKTFPKTLTQLTPSGGRHLIYKVKSPVKQGTDVLGSGLDIRSRGGYIAGAGSLIDGKAYTMDETPVAEAPKWLLDFCKEQEQVEKERKTKEEPKSKVSQKIATERAIDYLDNQAPVAVQGAGGDNTTYKVVNRLRDIGVTQKNALKLLLRHWNDKCDPPWDPEDLDKKVDNAYTYGQNRVGVDSPEADFDVIEEEGPREGPIDRLNKEFAFIVLGGKSTILRQFEDGSVDYISVQAFHDLLKSDVIYTGKGNKKQTSQLWMSHPLRATYDKAELWPNQQAPKGIYNLWRGFACEPLGPKEKPTDKMLEGVAMFKEHALDNVCLGDQELYNWLLGYFAQLVQKPWAKPLTSIVFKGEKGVGKNALIDRVGKLFSGHYLVTSSKRYLTGQFNKHLASLLLFVLDEAFWSGDKQAEGILKDLITGHTHLIEHKNKEMFSVKNLTRVCIIGNEDWVVPASNDERRFAVFTVGNARQGDKPYFKKMRKLIDTEGGNRLLLKELLEYDLSKIEINEAPDTIGLLEQKLESLNPIHSWWFSCLSESTILGQEFQEGWPDSVSRSQLRDAYLIYAKQRNVRSWLPDASTFGRILQKCIPSSKSRRVRSGDSRAWATTIPPLAQARLEFETFIRHKIDWDEEDQSETNVIDASYLFS